MVRKNSGMQRENNIKILSHHPLCPLLTTSYPLLCIMVTTGRAYCYTLCIFCSLLVQFEHSIGLGDESVRRLPFVVCIVHCLQFERSGDSTILPHNVWPYILCPRLRVGINPIKVTTRRAHRYTCIVDCSQFEHSCDSSILPHNV